MKRHVLISVSAVALIAGAGMSIAQERSSPGGGIAPQAPSAQPGGENRGGTEPRGERLNQKGDQPMRTQEPRNERDQKGAQDQRSNQRENRAQEKASPEKGTTGQGKSTTGQGAAAPSGSAALTSEQRTKISTTIKQSNVRPLTNANFKISVGTIVPRSVTLYPLPAAVIEVHPQWRGYRFVLVGDEILVIEPDTHRIVAVIEA